ncbi:iron-sulfur cluster assembly scaffold protein [archaeon]|nr:iron-sulfur cluster assembly scaffold protein [archaeon]
MTDIISNDGKLWTYTDKVKEHFFNPRNVIKTTEEEKRYDKEADGIGVENALPCGDMMKMWIKVSNSRIVDCKWRTFGCAVAMASTSIFSEKVIANGGMKIDDALCITAMKISKDLEELPTRKIHCADLVHKTFKAAVEDYQNRK